MAGLRFIKDEKPDWRLLEEVAGILLDEGDHRCRWFVGHRKMDCTLGSVRKPLKHRMNRPGFRRHSWWSVFGRKQSVKM
jgi:hypothetical protein